MRTKNKLFFSIFFVSLFAGCSDNERSDKIELCKDIELSRSQQDIVDSQARFAFEFFKQMSASKGNENMTISPLSLSIDLAMLANGAGEETYKNIVNAINLPNSTPDELNTLYNTLIEELGIVDNKCTELFISNGLWNDKSVNIKDDFSSKIKDSYDATIQTIDFSDETNAKNLINQWASKKTNGKIKDLFGNKGLNATAFILCNATYFNGKWTNVFDNKKTQKRAFLNIYDQKNNVETMCSETADFMSVSLDNADVIRLAYGNKAFSMYIILPTLNDNVKTDQQYNSFIENLDYNWWTSAKDKLTPKHMYVTLPKFNVETQCECSMESLEPVIMSPDMSLMTDTQIGYLKISQYNNIEVSESGTIAASVTKVEGETAVLHDSFLVDSPFIFLIEEQSTGAILFMGKVVKF